MTTRGRRQISSTRMWKPLCFISVKALQKKKKKNKLALFSLDTVDGPALYVRAIE